MAKLQYVAVLVWAATAALLAISHLACLAQDTGGGGTAAAAANASVCRPSSCGDILNIGKPFHLWGDPQDCGDLPYVLECASNRAKLMLQPRWIFWVKAIWYENKVIQVINARAIDEGPSFLLSNGAESEIFYFDYQNHFRLTSPLSTVELITCSSPVEGHPALVEASSCMNTTSSRSREAAAAGSGTYLYWFKGERPGSDSLPLGCSWAARMVQYESAYSPSSTWESCSEARDALMQGFNLTWNDDHTTVSAGEPDGPVAPRREIRHYYPPYIRIKCQWVCSDSSFGKSSIRCFFCTNWYTHIEWWITLNDLSFSYKQMRIYSYKHMRIFYEHFLVCMAWLLIIVRTLIGYIALLAFLIYKLRRRLLGLHDDVEMFLAEYRNCMPTRYTYRQIRKMTGNFKEKLGQGGFGSVFKGKQLTGRPVAIKILSESNSNGQDFINEVATIGRIHHANVVQLVGFCVEGSKKALVYELMPQGSLDRYIYENKEGSTSTNSNSSTSPPLSWAKTLEVAIGIARGIEYLHRGCNMKILHFDIKPQNVLLDTNFNPKVSDFGLAKSYPTEKNTVTVTAVRGTIGYMAPELFYESAGSSKSDVYSFGMLLMEMAGRRKNVPPDHAGSSSNEGYLPTWIYNQLEQGKDISVGGSNDEEKNIIYKLFMVALWCVQMKPVDRPSMGKVIEMLEGSAQQLQMPAGKPFLCSSTDRVNFEDLVITGSDSSEVSIVLPPHASA